jgi:hypothetical protein
MPVTVISVYMRALNATNSKNQKYQPAKLRLLPVFSDDTCFFV